MGALSAVPVLLLALAAEPQAAPRETGIAALARDLALALASRFPAPEGRVLEAAGDRVVVDLPHLAPATELEWLVPDGDFSQPISLAAAGSVLRPCGRIRISASGARSSAGRATPREGCPPPSPGDPVRAPGGALRIRIAQGSAPPELAGLLRVLVAVLPSWLERSGRFAPDSGPPPGRVSGLALDLPASDLDASLRQSGLDAVATLSVARRGDRIEALADLVAASPRALRDVAQIEAAAIPEALWRPDRATRALARERAAIDATGRVLALAVARSGGIRPAQILVLTDRELLALSPDAEGTLHLESLVALADLPAASVPARIPAGTVVADARTGDTCFATTLLAAGWCRQGSALRRVDGVPLAGVAGLLLGRYLPGTNLLDGFLRSLDGGARGDVGPFLSLAPWSGGALLVHRPSGNLEWLDGELGATGRRVLTGDAWTATPEGLVLGSAPEPGDGADQVIPLAGAGSSIPIAGRLVALAVADVDGDAKREIVAATAAPGGRSRLSLLPLD